MLVAVIQNPTAALPWWRTISLCWFDMALLGTILFGSWRGRRHGMTKELLPTLQWLAILFGAAFGHPLLADLLEQQGYIKALFGNQVKEHTAALLSAYVVILAVVFICFTLLKRKLNSKLEGSNMFGGWEYYLGTTAGILRYLSMLLVALALLNGPVYTAADIAATKAYNNRWYGGGLKDYSGDFIPSLADIQDSIFKQSISGPFIKDKLSILLINSAPSGAAAPYRNGHN